MKVPFTKMHGTSNDFVVVDELDGELVPKDKKADFAICASDRSKGVGSDGVIFVGKSDKADAKFVFYNPDGTIAEMDGNGIRCFAKYLYDHGYVEKTDINIETLAGVKNLVLTLFNEKVEQVSVDMGGPQLLRSEMNISGSPSDTFICQDVVVDGIAQKVTCVGTGNPHAVIFVEDARKVNVIELGRKIRNMKSVFTKGINVHFVQKVRENEFKIRSYERGVENETLACGTGACASAVAAVLNGMAVPERTFIFNAIGGELQVKLKMVGERIAEIFLIGAAVEVFKGEMEYEPTEKFQKAAFTFIRGVMSQGGN